MVLLTKFCRYYLRCNSINKLMTLTSNNSAMYSAKSCMLTNYRKGLLLTKQTYAPKCIYYS